MPFAHDVAGGNGNLIATSLQSPGFTPGDDTGWQVTKDGTATFNAVIARGDITATAFQGPDFTINADGIFMYSGPI